MILLYLWWHQKENLCKNKDRGEEIYVQLYFINMCTHYNAHEVKTEIIRIKGEKHSKLWPKKTKLINSVSDKNMPLVKVIK